jgi:alpha-tubulin suppressor-like RCC1 family protein
VVITNVYGSLTSSPALLTIVDGPPIIASQPANSTNLSGTTATFSVVAQGTAPLNYQWQFNGVNLDRATNSLLTLEKIRRINAGPYQVVVTNAWGSVTSSIATLTVVRTSIVAWGNNNYGETNVPNGLTDVVGIDAGIWHSLALQADGQVFAWGYNYYGEANVPSGLTNVVAISAGAYHSLALQPNGTVVAWGDNGADQCSVPSDLTNAMAISGGFYHSLALRANNTVTAWGGDFYGETEVPAGLTNVVAIAAGTFYSLTLQSNGTVMNWGRNTYGQTNVPSDLTNVMAIAAGSSHSLALQTNGTVVAWGYNGAVTNVPPDLTNIVAIAAGASYSLALRADGTVAAWGIGNFSLTNLPQGMSNVVAIAAGSEHALAIKNDGSPFIVRQTGSQTTLTNTTVVFSVTALGQSPLSYRWQKNGSNLTDSGNVSGSATPALTLTGVQASDMAAYTVVITNDIDYITSSPALLTVIGPPIITLQPLGLTVNMGTNVQFSITALGYPAPVYQWWQNGTNPVGLNSSNLTLLSVGRPQNGVYCVQVTNAWGNLFSSNAVLKVLVPQKLGLPVLLPDGTLRLLSGDADGGLLTPADLPNFDASASTNLTDWVTLPGALSLTNGMLLLQEGGTTNWPQRYYRITEKP